MSNFAEICTVGATLIQIGQMEGYDKGNRCFSLLCTLV